MFFFIDHQNGNRGTLYPGSYSIPGKEFELLAEVEVEDRHICDVDQEDFIYRQIFLWAEAWQRVRPEGARLISVVVPLDRSSEGQAQLKSMYQRGKGILSDEDKEFTDKTPLGQAFLKTTILGRIFDDLLPSPEWEPVERSPVFFRVSSRDGLAECADSPYESITLRPGVRGTP